MFKILVIAHAHAVATGTCTAYTPEVVSSCLWLIVSAGVSCTVLSLVGVVDVVDVCGFVLVDFVIHADVPCAVGSLTDVVDMMSAAMAGCVVVGLVDCEIVSVVSE